VLLPLSVAAACVCLVLFLAAGSKDQSFSVSHCSSLSVAAACVCPILFLAAGSKDRVFLILVVSSRWFLDHVCMMFDEMSVKRKAGL
jgi:hypothetical protein